MRQILSFLLLQADLAEDKYMDAIKREVECTPNVVHTCSFSSSFFLFLFLNRFILNLFVVLSKSKAEVIH